MSDDMENDAGMKDRDNDAFTAGSAAEDTHIDVNDGVAENEEHAAASAGPRSGAKQRRASLLLQETRETLSDLGEHHLKSAALLAEMEALLAHRTQGTSAPQQKQEVPQEDSKKPVQKVAPKLPRATSHRMTSVSNPVHPACNMSDAAKRRSSVTMATISFGGFEGPQQV